MAGSGTAHLRSTEMLLRVENLVVEFPIGRHQKVHAVSDVSFDIANGETLSLVGESGCGKSTTGRSIVQLPPPSSGQVIFESEDLGTIPERRRRALRPRFQMIHQDPISSLNPRRTVRQIVEEPWRIWRRHPVMGTVRPDIDTLLESVGLGLDMADRRPHQMSGGQCQRVAIARALVFDPSLLICDEPVSSLDVSVQAQILNLLEEMKQRYGLTMLFISHDLAVVKRISDRIAVMYLGKLCEVAIPDTLHRQPAHPYTAALLSAVPEPDPDTRKQAAGLVADEMPSPVNPPSGCRFRTRCPRAEPRCTAEEPIMRAIDEKAEHFVACHFPLVGQAAPASGDSARPGPGNGDGA